MPQMDYDILPPDVQDEGPGKRHTETDAASIPQDPFGIDDPVARGIEVGLVELGGELRERVQHAVNEAVTERLNEMSEAPGGQSMRAHVEGAFFGAAVLAVGVLLGSFSRRH